MYLIKAKPSTLTRDDMPSFCPDTKQKNTPVGCVQTEDKVTERWLCFFRKELQKWEKNGIIEIGSEGKKW